MRPSRHELTGWLVGTLAMAPALARAEGVARLAAPKIELEGGVIRQIENPLTDERYTIPDAQAPPEPEVRLLPALGRDEKILPTGVLRTQLERLDKALVVRQQADRPEGGLRSIRLRIGPLDLARVRLLIPGTGGVLVDRQSPLISETYPYPGHWSTPMVLIQGERGGVAVWGLDARRPFLALVVSRSATGLTIDLETSADPPWPTCKQMASPAWHLQAYEGEWPDAAERYRKLMGEHFKLEPISHRLPAWARETRCVIRVLGPPAKDGKIHPAHRGALELVAARMPPQRVLLYLPNWRTHEYDVMYPDYEPSDDAICYVKAARAMGFRVMLHGNLVGISPYHPKVASFEDVLQRDPVNGQRVGWYLDRDVQNKIYCLNPASPKARKILVESYRHARSRIEFDALHLDYPVLINTADGRLNGLNTIGGCEVYVRELAEALPGIHFATEGIFDFLLPCSFAQLGEPFWNYENRYGYYHPIRTAIFWPYCRNYGHLGIPDQQTDLSKFLGFLDAHERTGTLPTFTINSDQGLDRNAPGTDLALQQTAHWTRVLPIPAPDLMVAQPRPTWMMGGRPLFTWRLSDGRGAGTVQTDQGRQWLEQDESGKGRAVWTVVNGINELKTTQHIPGWLAYDDRRIIGLDPAGTYLLKDQRRDPSAFHLTWASGPVLVRAADADEARDILDLDPLDKPFLDLTKVAPDRTGVVNRGRERELTWHAVFQAGSATCGGVSLPAYHAHPPWAATAEETARADLGKDALVFGEFRVKLPADGQVALATAIGLRDLDQASAEREKPGRPLSDGVTFRVRANGEVLFERHWSARRWEDICVDLSRWTGQNVVLRLEAHPGPAGHVGWDWAAWGNPRIVQPDSPRRQTKLRIHQPAKVTATIVTDMSGSRVLSGSAAELSVSLPATVIYPKKLVSLPAGGADLLKIPFTPYTSVAGVTERRSVWGSGRIGSYTVGDVTMPGVHGHPPAFGMTRLEWLGVLPLEPLKLRFSAGLIEHAEAVTFRVRVNGKMCWAHHLPYSSSWVPGEIDLSPHAGKPVLLASITDSVGSNNCDWAVWGWPRLEPARRDQLHR